MADKINKIRQQDAFRIFMSKMPETGAYTYTEVGEVIGEYLRHTANKNAIRDLICGLAKGR